MSLEELKKTELKDLAREYGLPVSGNKAELLALLREHGGGPTVVELEVVEEDIEVVGGATEEVEELEEAPEVEVDIMESETPVVVTNPLAEARKHYMYPGSISGEWIFDDVPGSISARTLDEALEKWNTLPGQLRVSGSH